MRILNINPKGSNFSFKVPIPALGSKLSSTQKLLEIVTSLRISFFLLMLFLLPFSPYFFSYRNLVSIDSSAFIFVVLMLLITGSFYAVEVVLSKNERVIDPNGSLIILMFGLLVTAASALLIFTDYESSANTFGLVGEYSTFKAVSGLSIIAGMATYYLTQLFAHQRSSFSGIVKALSLGFVYFELFSLFNEDYSQLISVNIVAVLFTCVGIFLFRNTLLKSATIISFIISLANILKINEFTDMRVLFMIALLIISLVVSYLVFSFRFEDVEAYFSNYFKNWKGVFKKNVALNLRIHRALKLLAFPLYFALPLFIIVLAIQLISGDSLGTIWQPYATLYSRSFDQINTDFVTLLIGTGAGSVAYNGGTLFSQIISANGLIGIVAYALIFSFGIYQSIKRICNINIRGHRFLVDFVASIYVMLIPIMGIVITEVEPTATRNNMNLHIHYFFLMIIWWICLAIVSGLNKNNIVEFTVNRIRKGKTKFARLLVKIFALTLFLISYILIYTVLKNVGTLL